MQWLSLCRIGLSVLFLGAFAVTGCTSSYDVIEEPQAGPTSESEGTPPPGSQQAATPEAASESSTPPESQATGAASVVSSSGAGGDSGSSWLKTQQNLPFDVTAYLAEREPSADDPRLQHYRAALAELSPDVGGQRGRQLGSRVSELGGDAEKLAKGSVPPGEIDQVLRDARTAVEELRRAQSTPPASPRKAVFVFDLRIDALLPEVQAARDVARLMTLEVEQARRTGDLDSALEAVQRTLQLSRDLQPRGSLVSQLVSMAIDGVVFSSITQLILPHPNLTTQQCDRLIEMLEEHQEQSLPRYIEGLKVEYVTSMNSIEAIRDGELDAELFFGIASSAGAPPHELAYDVEFDAMSRLMKLALDEADVPYPNVPTPTRFDAAVQQAQQEAKAALQRGETSVPIATLLVLPAVQAAREAEVRTRTASGGLQTLLAVRRYQLEHQMLPSDLSAAIAESPLESIPEDEFVGQPLKYVVLEGRPTVYSVGKDQRDDQGLKDWQYGAQPGDYLFQMPPH